MEVEYANEIGLDDLYRKLHCVIINQYMHLKGNS
jgi:hypothetical protein